MEFDLIHRHFKTPFEPLVSSNAGGIPVGIGDDCAALRLKPNHLLYVSTDTLVENVHFFSDDPASLVGWKCLASNLSDLAACGASPIGFTLNLSLPGIDEAWLAEFSLGLLELAQKFNCPLVGGDTTSAGASPLKTLSITVFGQAPDTHAGFHRSLGKPGEQVWVSGCPGVARLGLLLQYRLHGLLEKFIKASDLPAVQRLLGQLPTEQAGLALQALQKPLPRVDLGKALQGKASACIDLSDGLGGDLGHIAKASQCAAMLDSAVLKQLWLQWWPGLEGLSDSHLLLDTLVHITLAGGDDFELCFTANDAFETEMQRLGHPLHVVGTLAQGEGVWLQSPGVGAVQLASKSYNHFAESQS